MDDGMLPAPPFLTTSSEAIVVSAKALRALPQFNAELVALLIELLDHYTSRPNLHVVMNDRGRFLVILAARLLHHMPDERGHRLSKVRLAIYCQEWGICSRGRARAIGSALRWAGFLKAGPAVEDARARPIVPTAELDRLLISLWRRLYEMIARLMPEHGRLLEAVDKDESFTLDVEAALVSLNVYGVHLLDRAPRLRAIADRNAGLAIVIFTSIRLNGGDPAPSIASLARQFSVSRAHVRQVMQIAEIDNLFTDDIHPAARLEACPLLDECANLTASLLVILIEVGTAHSAPRARL